MINGKKLGKKAVNKIKQLYGQKGKGEKGISHFVLTKLIAIMLVTIMVLTSSFAAYAADYTEGEQAYNEVLVPVTPQEVLMEEVCVDERGPCIDDGVKIKTVDGMKVRKDCWKYAYTKNCTNGPSKNNCSHIQQDDFKFVGDTCLHNIKVNGRTFCINTRQVFARTTLQEQKINHGKIIMDPDNKDVVKNLLCKSFCLDGECSSAHKASQESNNEMAGSVAQLEMLSGVKNGLIDAKTLKFDIFSATPRRCHDKTDFHSNCCEESGWLKGIGLVKCPSDAVQLAIEGRKGRCEYVDEYCSAEVPIFGCIRVTKTYCCFPTVLAKVIHRGARQQLGKSLGTAEYPQCGGLTIDEIEKIDFSRIDFQDFFDLEVQPMIRNYNSDDNAALIKRSFPNASSEQPSLNNSKNGLNEQVLQNTEKEGK